MRIGFVALVLLLAGCAEGGGDPAAPDSAVTASPAAVPTGVDYVLAKTWHRADGTTTTLPHDDYYAAVVWNDRLVATRYDGEVFAFADVIAPNGTVAETLRTTSSVVVNDAGTTIAWVATNGDVMTAWPDGRVKIGEVDLAAAGESVAYSAAAITGGPSCKEEEGGCVVYLNSGVGKPRTFDSHGVNDNPLPKVVTYKDVSGKNLVTYVDKVEDTRSCGGLVDLNADEPKPKWITCKNQAAQISPDGTLVIGLPGYYDGLGISEIAVLDAATGEQKSRYATAKDGFVSQWAWSKDGRLVFDFFQDGMWRLRAMTVDGEVTDIGDRVPGEDADSPFALIQH
ncbi:MAG: hypothetical protein ACT4QG_20175 [Sporichthyaceae bacterium]